MITADYLLIARINPADYGIFLVLNLPSGVTKNLPLKICYNGMQEAEAYAEMICADMHHAVEIVIKNFVSSQES